MSVTFEDGSVVARIPLYRGMKGTVDFAAAEDVTEKYVALCNLREAVEEYLAHEYPGGPLEANECSVDRFAAKLFAALYQTQREY